MLVLRPRGAQARERDQLVLASVPPHAGPDAGAGAGEDEAAHEAAAVEGHELRRAAAHGEAEEVDLRDVEGRDEADDVLRPPGVGARDDAGRPAHARVVEEEDRPLSREGIDEGWVPVVHCSSAAGRQLSVPLDGLERYAPEVHEHHERNAVREAEPAVGKLDSGDGGELVLGIFVGSHGLTSARNGVAETVSAVRCRFIRMWLANMVLRIYRNEYIRISGPDEGYQVTKHESPPVHITLSAGI